jgi:uncharacterized protein with HEPN domain
MARHDTLVSLRHMRDHGREAIALTTGKRRQDLETDRLLNLALVRLLEVIGEAANRVPPEDRALYPQIPWAPIVGLRHRLIHAYDQVDMDIIWEILKRHLPPLIDYLDQVVPPDDAHVPGNL